MSNSRDSSEFLTNAILNIANACKTATVSCANGVAKTTVLAVRSTKFLLSTIYRKCSDHILHMVEEYRFLRDEKHEIARLNWEKLRLLQNANEEIVKRAHKPFTLPAHPDAEMDLLLREKLREASTLLFFLPEELQKKVPELLEFDPFLCEKKSDLETWRNSTVKVLDEFILQQELCDATLVTMQNREYIPGERVLFDKETCLKLWRDAIQPLFFADRDLGCWCAEMELETSCSEEKMHDLLNESFKKIFGDTSLRHSEETSFTHGTHAHLHQQNRH